MVVREMVARRVPKAVIAAKLGCKPSTLKALCSRYRIHRYHYVDREKVRKLVKQGVPDVVGASRLNCTEGTFGRIRRELGVYRSPQNRYSPQQYFGLVPQSVQRRIEGRKERARKERLSAEHRVDDRPREPARERLPLR